MWQDKYGARLAQLTIYVGEPTDTREASVLLVSLLLAHSEPWISPLLQSDVRAAGQGRELLASAASAR